MDDATINENGIESYIDKMNKEGLTICFRDIKERIEVIYIYLIKNKFNEKVETKWFLTEGDYSVELEKTKWFLDGLRIQKDGISFDDPDYQNIISSWKKIGIWNFDNEKFINQRICLHIQDYFFWLKNELKAEIEAKKKADKEWQEEHSKRSFWGKIKHYFE